MSARAVGFALGLSFAASAYGHDPGEPFAEWFQSLRSPKTGSSCCSAQRDCKQVDDYRAGKEPGSYEVKYEGAWVSVPADVVLQRIDNPTARPVLCIGYIDGQPYARCFVRSSES